MELSDVAEDEIIDRPIHAERKPSPFPSLPGHAIRLVWEDLEVKTMDGKRRLLSSLNGDTQGKLLAIMGPTGAGKTTLMNSLAYRVTGVQSEGEMEINGSSYDGHVLKGVSGYVMQDDILFENLTVAETLSYAAELRLPRHMTALEKRERVEETLTLMQLAPSRDLLVGNPRLQGISGSERKRLCVAVELLMRPRLLFLDEPTTGLDSTGAFSLMSILKDLASSGACSIVATIHQPQEKIVRLFDDLIVLYEGQLVYFGPAEEVSEQYAKAGFPCPPGTNPADHLMETVTPMSSEERELVRENAMKLIQLQQTEHPETITATRSKSKLERKGERIDKGYRRVSWFTQLCILFRRAFLLQMRNYPALVTEFIQGVIIAVLIGTAFLDIGITQASYSKRLAALFFIALNQGDIASMIAVNAFPAERAVVIRERAAGTYHVSAYFVGKSITDMVTQFIFPITFCCIVYFLIGFQSSASKFFIFMVIVVLLQATGFAMSNFIASVGRTTRMSLVILPMALEIWRLFGGFFLPPTQLPSYFVWLDAIDFIKYGFVGLALNELEGLVFTCDPNIKLPCTFQTGEDILKSRGYDQFSIGECIGVLVAFLFGFRILNYIMIRFLK